MNYDDVEQIGTRIKEVRKRKSITITKMALYTGLSVGYLSNVERNQASPTLRNLQTICTALGVSISEMLRTEKQDKTLVRREDQILREYPAYNQTVRMIDFCNKSGLYEFITVRPGQSQLAAESVHPYAEMCTILSGQLTVEIEGEEYHLKEGDALYIKAHCRHVVRNDSDQVCESFWHQQKPEDED